MWSLVFVVLAHYWPCGSLTSQNALTRTVSKSVSAVIGKELLDSTEGK